MSNTSAIMGGLMAANAFPFHKNEPMSAPAHAPTEHHDTPHAETAPQEIHEKDHHGANDNAHGSEAAHATPNHTKKEAHGAADHGGENKKWYQKLGSGLVYFGQAIGNIMQGVGEAINAVLTFPLEMLEQGLEYAKKNLWGSDHGHGVAHAAPHGAPAAAHAH